MAKRKYFVDINQERCKGCGLCIDACPKKIIEFSDKFNSKGYHPAQVIDQDACIGCGFCYQMCPDVCITVYRVIEEEEPAKV